MEKYGRDLTAAARDKLDGDRRDEEIRHIGSSAGARKTILC